jgi:hypothetical protein
LRIKREWAVAATGADADKASAMSKAIEAEASYRTQRSTCGSCRATEPDDRATDGDGGKQGRRASVKVAAALSRMAAGVTGDADPRAIHKAAWRKSRELARAHNQRINEKMIAPPKKRPRTPLEWAAFCQYWTAWAVVLSAQFTAVCCTLIFGTKFGEQGTKIFVITWATSLFTAFCVVEPFEIFLLVAFPWIADNAVYANIKEAYNNIFV